MYTDGEETSDLDEDFRSALALLHSNEENSAERLRRLLDAAIDKKQASNVPLSARVSKKYTRMTKSLAKSIPIESQEKRSDIVVPSQTVIDSGKLFEYQCMPLLGNNAVENDSKVLEFADLEYDGCNGKADIPRISIPDEGSADELLCKICNGARLGPLILLECQDCQDGYHPLCHQPPVVDIDIYDPRIVWRCSKCIELSPLALSTHVSAKRKCPNKFQHSDNVCASNGLTTAANKTGEVDLQDTTIEISTTGNGWTDLMQSGNPTPNVRLVEDTFDVIKETTKIPPHAVKRRIGSKFLAARPITKRQ